MSNESLIPDFPPMTYADSQTGHTVRFGHAASRAVAANIVALGRPAKRIGPIQTATYNPTTGIYNYTVGYSRSHSDIKQLFLQWWYRPQGSGIHSGLFVTLSLEDELGNTIPFTDPLIPQAFKNDSVQPPTATSVHNPACFIGGKGYLDLDAIAAVLTGASWKFTFSITNSSDAPVELIEGWECPRSMVADTEFYGALTGPLNPGNPILAGTTTTDNYARIRRTLSGGIAANHTLLSVAWPFDSALAPYTSSTIFTAFFRMLEAGTTPWSWRVRPRAVYNPNSASGEPHRVRYYYRLDTTAGAPTGFIQCSTGATGSPYTTPVLASTVAVWSDWVNIDIPTNGTDRIATLQFIGKVNAVTSTLRLFSIQVEEIQ